MDTLSAWVMTVALGYLVYLAIEQALKTDEFRPLIAVLVIVVSLFVFKHYNRDMVIGEGEKCFLDQVTVVGESRFRATIEVVYIDGQLKERRILYGTIRKCYLVKPVVETHTFYPKPRVVTPQKAPVIHRAD